MLVNLEGKTALVCGASAGIGKAVAMEFAQAGARVILLARNEDKLKDTQFHLKAHPKGHEIIVCDLNQLEPTRKKIQSWVEHNRGIDILVNNAGGPNPGTAAEASVSDLESAMKTHLFSSLNLTQAVLPYMRTQKFGRIVHVISTSVKIPIAGLGISNMVRGAVGNLVKTLSLELGVDGITVNAVLPGYTRTERLQEIIKNRAVKRSVKEEVIEDEMKKEVPLRRFASPAEVAAAVTFLASPVAGYINGVALPVDGGRTGCF